MKDKRKLIDAEDLLNDLKKTDPEGYEQINKMVEIRGKKFQEFKEKNIVPEFETIEEYTQWLTTPVGRKYARELEKISDEAERIASGRGGYREGAGRPAIYPERKTITKKLLPETLELLKDFSKENKVSENEALDRLINAGYRSLKLKKA